MSCNITFPPAKPTILSRYSQLYRDLLLQQPTCLAKPPYCNTISSYCNTISTSCQSPFISQYNPILQYKILFFHNIILAVAQKRFQHYIFFFHLFPVTGKQNNQKNIPIYIFSQLFFPEYSNKFIKIYSLQFFFSFTL